MSASINPTLFRKKFWEIIDINLLLKICHYPPKNNIKTTYVSMKKAITGIAVKKRLYHEYQNSFAYKPSQ
jgi:hypothetical protein